MNLNDATFHHAAQLCKKYSLVVCMCTYLINCQMTQHFIAEKWLHQIKVVFCLMTLHLLLHGGTATVSSKTNKGFEHAGQLWRLHVFPCVRLRFFQVVLVSSLSTHIPFFCFGDNKMPFCINECADPGQNKAFLCISQW